MSTKFRAMTTMAGCRVNGQITSGWITLDDTGDISVKSLVSTDPVCHINDIQEVQSWDNWVDRKYVIIKTPWAEQRLKFSNWKDAKVFVQLLSRERPLRPPDQGSEGTMTPDEREQAAFRLVDQHVDVFMTSLATIITTFPDQAAAILRHAQQSIDAALRQAIDRNRQPS
jgi:hypothetical protein